MPSLPPAVSAVRSGGRAGCSDAAAASQRGEAARGEAGCRVRRSEARMREARQRCRVRQREAEAALPRIRSGGEAARGEESEVPVLLSTPHRPLPSSQYAPLPLSLCLSVFSLLVPLGVSLCLSLSVSLSLSLCISLSLSDGGRASHPLPAARRGRARLSGLPAGPQAQARRRPGCAGRGQPPRDGGTGGLAGGECAGTGKGGLRGERADL